MYKKVLVLTLITCLSNPILAETVKSTQRFQSCDPQQIALDSLAAEDEQLRHLTAEAPFFTAPMKGIVIATAGIGLGVASLAVKDETISKSLSNMGFTVFITGTGYAILSGWENGLQREVLRNSLIARNKKN